MQEYFIRYEIISSLVSIFLLIFLFIKYTQYKKRLQVLKKFEELKQNNQLSSEDKKYIHINLRDYRIQLEKDEGKLKLIYPVLILIAGVLLAFLPMQSALIYINVLIVIYIYFHLAKLYTKNFIILLEQLSENLD